MYWVSGWEVRKNIITGFLLAYACFFVSSSINAHVIDSKNQVNNIWSSVVRTRILNAMDSLINEELIADSETFWTLGHN